MLVTRNLRPSLWELVLPAEVRRMSPLLEQVDRGWTMRRSWPRSGARDHRKFPSLDH
jgi:hypothetical protein